MKELSDILHAYRLLDGRATDAALATVVSVEGSAYRRPGARMLITGDGRIVGGVSGGCLERDVIQRAGAVVSCGDPALVRYNTSSDPENGMGYSLGCGGAIDILIESLNTPAGEQLMRWLETSQNSDVTIATLVSKHHPVFPLGQRFYIDHLGQSHGAFYDESIIRQAADIGRSQNFQFESAGGKVKIFLDVLHPPQHLIIFGAGNDAIPLVRFARGLGWKVTVVDVGSSPTDLGRTWEVDEIIRCRVDDVPRRVAIGASVAVVVMTHNFAQDAKLMKWLATQTVQYLGLLGPRHRTDQMLQDMHTIDVHSPVGLDLGAESPEEVALAIVAEITAVLHGRCGGPLSQRSGSIHPHPVGVAELECPVAAS